jgi:hypothetical protein
MNAGGTITVTGRTQNWGAQPFAANVNSWYWGHGRIGPFDFLALNGTEYVSAYASECGAIVSASCAPNALRVRPTGDDTYPPHRSTGDPSGYHITLDLGGNGTLVVDASITGIPMDNVLDEYSRYVGILTGSVVPVGEQEVEGAVEVLQGKAIFEQFKLTE